MKDDIFWSDEDDGYIADVPDLEAWSAFGRTPAEALAEVERARQAWLEVARGLVLARGNGSGGTSPPPTLH